MHRRSLLATGSLVAAGGLALAACGGPPATPAQIIADISGALDGAARAVPALASSVPPILAPALAAALEGDVAAARALLASIGAGTPAQTGATVLAKVSGYLNAILSALAALPLPPRYALIIAAANIIAQEVEAYLATIIPAPVNPAVAARASSARLSLPAARAELGVSDVP